MNSECDNKKQAVNTKLSNPKRTMSSNLVLAANRESFKYLNKKDKTQNYGSEKRDSSELLCASLLVTPDSLRKDKKILTPNNREERKSNCLHGNERLTFIIDPDDNFQSATTISRFDQKQIDEIFENKNNATDDVEINPFVSSYEGEDTILESKNLCGECINSLCIFLLRARVFTL